MRIGITKEWCLKMAQLEDDSEIGAGMIAIDPVFDGEQATQEASEQSEPSIAFSRLLRLMRRNQGLSVEKLAEDAKIEMEELVGIEEDAHFRPKVRTVYQIANYFQLSQANLLQVARLTTPRDPRLAEEAVRFAARSEPVVALTPEERAALDAFVAVLSERK